MNDYELDLSNSQSAVSVDLQQLRQNLFRGLQCEQVAAAVLSVSVVDDATIHRLNRQHLQHDYPTDVISFPLDWSCPGRQSPGTGPGGRAAAATIEGEIVVSAEFAAESAGRCGWSVDDELTLYVIHGMLHICGYDDLSPDEKTVMRAREVAILSELGLQPQYPDDAVRPEFGDDDEPPGSAAGSDRSPQSPEAHS